jgi:DNA-binding NtrC family response regulator
MAREIPNRVLVVDDEPLIRWSLCTALAAAGFDAVGAEDAPAALRLAAEWPPPRVALIDWGPAKDTPRLVTEVRRIHPTCRFVLMTTADRRDLVAPGSWDAVVVDKPFDLAWIVALVSDAAEGRGSASLDLRKGA